MTAMKAPLQEQEKKKGKREPALPKAQTPVPKQQRHCRPSRKHPVVAKTGRIKLHGL